MSDDKNIDELLIEGHDYDGIQELDHPLPRWWVYLFYATIIWGISYFSYYEFLGGPSHKEQYLAAMAKIEKRRESAPKAQVDLDVNVAELLNDKAALAVGAKSFGQYCAACHGGNGEGVIGPNLTDKFWLHSKGKYEGIITAILNGFPTKGMPPWGEIVPKEDQAPLAVYVISLQGTNPANPKDPQGEAIQ